MTRLEAERFGEPATLRDLRVLRFARERAVDGLAGRTVWCATALPGGRDAACVVETDRGEHVGGIMHARPTVATR